VKRLFGASITAADGQAPVWHEDVRYFQIADETGMQSLTLFGSLQSPSPEAGWAWMDYCIGRAKLMTSGTTTIRKPVAYLVCKLPPVEMA